MDEFTIYCRIKTGTKVMKDAMIAEEPDLEKGMVEGTMSVEDRGQSGTFGHLPVPAKFLNCSGTSFFVKDILNMK